MTTENQNNTMTAQIDPDEKQKYTKSELILLALAFVLAVLCDRLFFNIILNSAEYGDTIFFTSIFEICVLVFFCVFNRRKIYDRPLLWVVAGLITTLCIWNFIFDYTGSYGVLSFVVIPASLMMFTQLSAEAPDLKNIKRMAISWFSGWIIKPFAAIHRCLGALSSLLFPKNSESAAVVKKVIAALIVTVPLVSLLAALLSGADKVFGYYAGKIFSAFSFSDLILHGFLTALAFLVFYSFFWHNRYKKAQDAEIRESRFKIADLSSYIVLGSVLALYVLFCAVQFAYLFASAGLPAGISHSEYAREGFAQIVVISCINLIIFGVAVKYGGKDIVQKIMLYALVGVTAIMLVSGFMRLWLYIDTFGMTFLRLISAWFIIYLALVLILCALRLAVPEVPLVAVCAALLLVCYNVLGYINPDAFIVNYNLNANPDCGVNDWVEENQDYVFYDLSDDALNALLDRGMDKGRFADSLGRRYGSAAAKKSFGSAKLESALQNLH